MTAFAGIVGFDGAPGNFAVTEQIVRAVTARQKTEADTLSLDGAVFAARGSGLVDGIQGGLPLQTTGDGRALFVADARLDNRAELGAALAIAPSELAQISDSSLLLRAYRRRGEAGIAQCVGAFAFAFWDAPARRLVLGRDCLGARALFFHRADGYVAFATTLDALLALPRVPREIDEHTLANFLAFNLAEPRRTFYRGIERVPSRTLVTIDGSGSRQRHYWSPNVDAAPAYRRDEDYVERARELLDQAVAAATADTPDVAISASGGFDSSAVAATVARLGRAKSITCYTLVAPAGLQLELTPFLYLDERAKMEALARMHPALNLRFFTAEKAHPYLGDDTRLFARMSTPVLGPANLGAFAYIYDAVAAGKHRAMFVGVSGNFGLTWTGDFSLLALLRQRQWATFARDLSALAQDWDRGLLRATVRELVMPAAPRALRRLLYRLRGRDPDSVARFSALNPDFIAATGLARQWREAGFDPWFGWDGWNPARHRARFLFDDNQFGRDFRATTEELRGYDTRDPLGDRRLLEFLLTIPEPVYRRHGVPRSFARAVLADRLPREILKERRRGAQGVTWFAHLQARRKDIAAELERLEASASARRLIDLPRLKKLLDHWPKDANAAERRRREYRGVLNRGVHIGRFIRWVEGGNA